MSTPETTRPAAPEPGATPAPTGGTAPDAPRTREPLGARFAHLFAFSGLSNLADGIVYVGVPLYAVTLTRSPGQISLLSAAVTLPWLLVALYAGIVVDRRERPRILAIATTVRIAVFLAMAAAAATGRLTLPVLIVACFVIGVAEVFADTSSGAILPDVTPATRLAAANSRLMGVQQVANSFLGGPLAGVLLALGAGWLFGIPAALLAVGLLVVVRGLLGKVPTHRAPAATSRRAELREGASFLFHHRVVRAIVLGGATYNLASAAYMAVFVLWVVGPGSAVGLDERAYGLLMAGFAVGALLGAVVAEPVVGTGRERRVVAVTWTFAALMLLVPVLVPEPWPIAAALAAAGTAGVIGNVATASLRQRLVPSRLLGRVAGVAATIAYGSMPLGALAGGLLGELFGVRVPLVVAPLVAALAAVVTVSAFTQRHVAEGLAAARRAAEAERVATIAG